MKRIAFLLLVCLFYIGLSAKEIRLDAEGRGDYPTLQTAIESVRAFDPAGWTIIYLKKGVYKEKVTIPTYCTQVKIIGESRDSTIITFDDHAKVNNMGTFRTSTLRINGNDIILENFTIQNNAEPVAQAVALHVEGDRIILNKCNLLGNQDTYYSGRENSRQFFNQCYIEGTTDFLFGPGISWFEQCQIHCKSNSYITATSTPAYSPYGFIFRRCNITHAPNVNQVYLGRPWRAFGMTLFQECALPACIRKDGWHNWSDVKNEKTARYFEYRNSGTGADRSGRVNWSKELSKKEVSAFTPDKVLSGFDNWKTYREYLKQ